MEEIPLTVSGGGEMCVPISCQLFRMFGENFQRITHVRTVQKVPNSGHTQPKGCIFCGEHRSFARHLNCVHDI